MKSCTLHDDATRQMELEVSSSAVPPGFLGATTSSASEVTGPDSSSKVNIIDGQKDNHESDHIVGIIPMGSSIEEA